MGARERRLHDAGEARHRHRLRVRRRLCLVPQAGHRAGGAREGLEGFNRATPVSGPTFVDATVNGRKLKRGARLWTVATATFKAETYRYLRIERPSDEDPR
jgi:phage terminase large subunit GpA-like protein